MDQQDNNEQQLTTEAQEGIEQPTEAGQQESIEQTAEAGQDKKNTGWRTTIAIALAVCFAFAAGMTVAKLSGKGSAVPTVTEAPVAAETASTPAPTPEPIKAVDFDALYAAHAPEDEVLSINGESVTWGEYFYCLFSQATEIQTQMQQMQMYYGMEANWDDPVSEDGKTVAELTVDNSLEMLKQQKAIRALAAEGDIVLNEDEEQALAEQRESLRLQLCGEDATDEEFNELLQKLYLRPEAFDEVNRLSSLYKKLQSSYAEAVSDEDALQYLTDNAYIAANHILFLSVDPTTRESLDEATIAEKKAKAEEVAKELAAIEDESERRESFAKIKAEQCEDTGKQMLPDGYLFTPGTMVPEFEEATKALKPYEVSGVVESTYGFHILMGLPLDPDMPIEPGTTARTLSAKAGFNAAMQDYMDNAVVERLNGYTDPKLTDYLK